ncbi:GspH/FimT family pseudopilin [Oceanicoccus sp. KOV_DT_Chl]|uniref:GspH/FimT family pseudopilin n=1 Tax=Oceanicoccus sp. KOV_DT_Chl TaxID=1904639 RepID=UPI000C7E440F|nr:GspH/FimT family pseudopilin [Oceanicoccus sp. KOV_DT_Chl]
MATVKDQQGFNLIELMAVLVVFAIIMGAGLPFLTATIERNAVSSQARVLYKSLSQARSAAINNNAVVTIERKSSTAKDWSEGWTVYIDVGGEGNQARDTVNDTYLNDFSVDDALITIRSNTAANNWVTFDANGRLDDDPVQIAVCDSDVNSAIEGQLISVSRVGRVSSNIIAAADKPTQCTPAG